MNPSLECPNCGHRANYHINRIFARVNYGLTLLIYSVFGLLSYLLGHYFFDTYWRGNVLIDDRVIEVTFGALLLPVVIAGVLWKSLNDAQDSFNAGRVPGER